MCRSSSSSALFRLALVVLVAAAPLARAGAQLDALQPGTRVRLRAPSVVAGRAEGSVFRRTPDTVYVARAHGAPPLAIPVIAITAAERRRGRDHGAGAARGALWGGGVGVALGALAARAAETCEGLGCVGTPSSGAVFAGTVAVGTGVGAGVGALIGVQRWQRLRVPARMVGGLLRLARDRPGTVRLTLHF